METVKGILEVITALLGVITGCNEWRRSAEAKTISNAEGKVDGLQYSKEKLELVAVAATDIVNEIETIRPNGAIDRVKSKLRTSIQIASRTAIDQIEAEEKRQTKTLEGAKDAHQRYKKYVCVSAGFFAISLTVSIGLSFFAPKRNVEEKTDEKPIIKVETLRVKEAFAYDKDKKIKKFTVKLSQTYSPDIPVTTIETGEYQYFETYPNLEKSANIAAFRVLAFHANGKEYTAKECGGEEEYNLHLRSSKAGKWEETNAGFGKRMVFFKEGPFTHTFKVRLKGSEYYFKITKQ